LAVFCGRDQPDPCEVPVSDLAAAAASARKGRKQSQRMTSVYIVEDEALLRDCLRGFVAARPGFSLAGSAADAETALRDCRKLLPDMILSDLRLPGMDGVEFARALKEIHPETRVLLVSGGFTPPAVRRALLARVSGIVEKSSGLAELEKALDAVAAGQSHYGDAVLKILPEVVAAKPEPQPLESLTERERAVLCLIADGLSTKEIAEKLKISARTADVHRMHIMTKLDAHNVASLTRIAIASGLADIPIR
jgi:DNA-binding NarL/FixJ family response regulator